MLCERSHKRVGAKVCELTAFYGLYVDFMWEF